MSFFSLKVRWSWITAVITGVALVLWLFGGDRTPEVPW